MPQRPSLMAIMQCIWRTCDVQKQSAFFIFFPGNISYLKVQKQRDAQRRRLRMDPGQLPKFLSQFSLMSTWKRWSSQESPWQSWTSHWLDAILFCGPFWGANDTKKRSGTPEAVPGAYLRWMHFSKFSYSTLTFQPCLDVSLCMCMHQYNRAW